MGQNKLFIRVLYFRTKLRIQNNKIVFDYTNIVPFCIFQRLATQLQGNFYPILDCLFRELG